MMTTEDASSRSNAGRAWLLVCLLLLAVTWLPAVGLHAYRMSQDVPGAGVVVVVFPPTLSTRDVFRKVADAQGSLVKPISWFRHAWLVQSLETGFAGRLKAQGAWGVFSTDLLSAEAFLNCFRISSPPDAADQGGALS